MQFTKLEDIFNLSIENLKVADAKRLLTKIRSLLKEEHIAEEKSEKVLNNPEQSKHKAITIVGDKVYILAFDTATGIGKVVDTLTDTRGQHMIKHIAEKFLFDVIFKQK